MEHLAILEKICDNIFDSMESGTPIYIFSAAIYDTWYHGTELEQNLAKRLVGIWMNELNGRVDDAYRETKYQENRREYDDYCKNWLENSYKNYNDNRGICEALRNILRNRGYGTQGLP
jgi:hypothetical protein